MGFRYWYVLICHIDVCFEKFYIDMAQLKPLQEMF
jgi:hypothetical protein